MQEFNLIEFHKTRDFSKKMNATFEFVKQNFKSLGKSILVIAGPPVLAASLLMASFFGDVFRRDMAALTQGMGGEAEEGMGIFSAYTWIGFFIAILFFMMSYIMTIATIYNYMILYGERQTNQIPVKDVWDQVRLTIWKYLRTTLAFFIVIIIIGVIVGVVVSIMGSINPVLSVLLVIAMVVGYFYVVFSLSLTFVVRAFEDKSSLPAMERSFLLVQGKWWSTFGLIFVLSLIVSIISYIPIIPWYVILIVSTIHNIESGDTSNAAGTAGAASIIMFTIYYLFSIVLSALPNIGMAFQYFNLVERKEARGLLEKIDNFDEPKSPTTPNEEEQY